MTETFWQRKREEAKQHRGENEAEIAGVRIIDSDVAPGQYHWEIIWIDALSKAENGGNHNAFIEAIRDGSAVRGLIVDWGWDGMRPDEKAHIDRQPLYMSKAPWEFGCDIAPHAGQVIWARIKDQPSQMFKGFDIGRVFPGEGLEWGHWSIYVVFEWKPKGLPAEEPPDRPPIPEPDAARELLERIYSDIGAYLGRG
jgi:hypothetical protein